MRLLSLILGLAFIATASFAAPYQSLCNERAYGNIPQTVGTVQNVFLVSANTVVSTTTRRENNSIIFSANGDFWACENSARCGSTFPTGSVSETGWLFNPVARMLRTSGTTVYLTSPVTGTVVVLEGCRG